MAWSSLAAACDRQRRGAMALRPRRYTEPADVLAACMRRAYRRAGHDEDGAASESEDEDGRRADLVDPMDVIDPSDIDTTESNAASSIPDAERPVLDPDSPGVMDDLSPWLGPGMDKDAAQEASPSCEQAERFEITLVTLAGARHSVRDLLPQERLMAVRRSAAAWLSIPTPLLALCHGDRWLRVEDNPCALCDLSIGPESVLTCVRAQGVALGRGRYALTARRLGPNDDTAEAVRAEFGERAAVADFAQLMGGARHGELRNFLDGLGLNGGSAFVLHLGRSNFEDGRGGHFFMCRHSGVVPPTWLVGPSLVFNDGYAINNLDLCWKPRGIMPVLVDLGPA